MRDVEIVPVPVKMGPMTVMAYALLGERVVLVDTGVPGQAGRILAALAEHGRSPADVSLIVLTHGHGDHAGSAEALREATGAPIALGAGDEEKCVAAVDHEMHGRGAGGRAILNLIAWRRRTRPAEHGPVADVTVTGELPLQRYGVDAVAVPLPGHTRGSLGVFTGSGDALVGDLLGGGGRTRKEPVPGILVCDEPAMDASIAEVLARRPRLTYTGHDQRPFTLAQLDRAFGAR